MARPAPSAKRIAIITEQMESIINIYNTFRQPKTGTGPYVDAEILSGLPIFQAEMPFFPKTGHVYLEPVFLRPLEEKHYERLLDDTFPTSKLRLQWPDLSTGYYAGKGVDLSAGHRVLASEAVHAAYDQLYMKQGEALPLLLKSEWCISSIVLQPSGYSGIYSSRDQHSYPADSDEWETEMLYDASGVGVPKNGQDCSSMKPHMSCILNHPVPFENRLLHSEIICLTQMIANRMEYYAWSAHSTIPVFCFTFNGPKVRLTQAHLDGHCLRLLRTEAVDLVHSDGSPNEATWAMLVRWLIGVPISVDKWEEDATCVSHNPTDHMIRPTRRAVATC